MTATPSPINLEALLDHARIHDGLGRGDSLELIQECRRLRALSASQAPVSPWSAEKPCPFCKSCGLPESYHVEGSRATGSDGKICESFIAWGYPAAPAPSTNTALGDKGADDLPTRIFNAKPEDVAGIVEEWAENLASKGADKQIAEGEAAKARDHQRRTGRCLDCESTPCACSQPPDVISKGAREYQCGCGNMFREVIPATPGPTDIEKAARDYAEAYREWHEDSQLFPSDEMLGASTDLLRALGLELVENEDENKWELRPLPSNGTNPKGQGEG